MAIPSPNPTGLAELERTLRWHFPRLHRELIDGPRAFPDPHLAIAGHLRVLLCDHKYPPVLLTFAKACGKDLVVYGCRPKRSQPGATILVAWSAIVASWTPSPEDWLEPYSAEEFMSTPIGVIFAIVAVRSVIPTRIDDNFAWMKGVNKDYLNALPQWPGP